MDSIIISDVRERLRTGERLTCGLVRMPCEEVVEMLGVAGLDVLLIDCEHGPADVTALRQHIALADAHGVPVLVRIGEGEHHLAQRALDQGAHGIVAPHVETAAAAEALVRAVRYPPRGDRGFATYPRAGRFGTRTAEEHRAAADAATFVLVMLESPGAIARAGRDRRRRRRGRLAGRHRGPGRRPHTGRSDGGGAPGAGPRGPGRLRFGPRRSRRARAMPPTPRSRTARTWWSTTSRR